MNKAVLFDLDGTLHDRESSLDNFLFAQHDRIPALRHITKEKYISRFTELDAHGQVWKDTVYQTLVTEFSVLDQTWQALLDDYETQFCYSASPFPALLSTLGDLLNAGYLLGIISNGRSSFQRRVIRELGIEHFFEVILISETEGVRKPESEIFERAVQRLNILPNQSVFIGDHPVTDIAGAKSVGMKTIWFRNSVWPSPENVDATIDGLRELPTLIPNLW